MSGHRYLVAGSIWLDRTDERLWQDHRLVRLGGRALALLRTLMERPRRLVTKNEIFDNVWPGLSVSESVLTTAVKEIRQALGDDARAPKLIETVHGRGYRFLLDVERRENAPEQTDQPRRPSFKLGARSNLWLGALAVLAILAAAVTISLLKSTPGGETAEAAATAHPKSIAVLPFEDLSSDRDQGWFAAGLTEEILHSLARTPDLRVAARTSTQALRPGDVRDIGRQLNVAHVLEGSVRRDGGRVRVTAQLIRAADGFHLWSENYDRSADDIISIQSDIAIAIAQALKTVMSPEQLQAMVRLGTRSVEAYEQYLRGRAYEQRQLETGDGEYGRLANDAYERARTIDPQFATAHWESARFWFGMATRVGSSAIQRQDEDRRLQEYLERVDAAIASSEGRSDNYRYRSARALMDLRFREALSLMQRFVEQHPRDADAWEELVDLAAYIGDRRLGARAAERIHVLSVESGYPRSRAITASVLSVDIPNAVARARQQLALRPGEALIQYQAHRALLWGGFNDEARAVLARIRESSLPRENVLAAELRQACAEGGRGAREIAAQMAQLPDASTSGAWHAAMLLGDRGRAVAVLRPLDRPERLTTLMQFLVYPTFDEGDFPLLHQRLRADGVRRPPPVEIPFACDASSAR